MATDFFTNDGSALRQLVDELYDRLREVRRAAEVKHPANDEFEMGINCRMANEEYWLEKLLDKVERS